MGLLRRLRALDDRVVPPGRWYERSVRLWWLSLVAPLPVVAAVGFAEGWAATGAALLSLQSGVHAGWFYNERCRRKGTGPRWRSLQPPGRVAERPER